MATVRWQGATFAAKPLHQLPNGDWIMAAQQHTPRTSIGTHVRVTKDEIVSMDDVDHHAHAKSMAELIKALDEERKQIPSVEELLAKHRDTLEQQGQ